MSKGTKRIPVRGGAVLTALVGTWITSAPARAIEIHPLQSGCWPCSALQQAIEPAKIALSPEDATLLLLSENTNPQLRDDAAGAPSAEAPDAEDLPTAMPPARTVNKAKAGEGTDEHDPSTESNEGNTPSNDQEMPADFQRQLEGFPLIEPTLPEKKEDFTQSALPLADYPLSQWDFLEMETPLFGTEEITEFSQRPLSLNGKWGWHPHLSVSTLYDGNVFLRSNDKDGDFITRIAPGISLRLGDSHAPLYLTADYTIGADLFAKNTSEDSLDHRAVMDLQWLLPRTTLGFHLGFVSDTGTSIDVTDRVRRQVYFAGITSHYFLTEKTSWDLNADYDFTDFGSLISSGEARLQGYFNYAYSPKTTFGLGGTLGQVTVEDGPDQVYEQLNFRTIYIATGKLTFTGEVGCEWRQTDGGDDTINPVFSLDAGWRVREGTTVSLDARRRIFASAIFQDQNYAETDFAITVRQRFSRHADVSLAVGYENNDYQATVPDVSATRMDNFYYIRPGVEWRPLAFLGVGLFYEYSQNISTGAGDRNFRRDRGGLQLSILF